jgi:hypothetical protein
MARSLRRRPSSQRPSATNTAEEEDDSRVVGLLEVEAA